jgi:cytochrome c553
MAYLSRTAGACLSAAFLAAAAPAMAADPAAGKALAGPCRVCHGLDGVGTNPMVPNIGGESAEYIIKQLKDFRDGRRQDPQMSIMAESLSDQQIQDLAAWYSSIVATFTVPQ